MSYVFQIARQIYHSAECKCSRETVSKTNVGSPKYGSIKIGHFLAAYWALAKCAPLIILMPKIGKLVICGFALALIFALIFAL